ncbi:MAG: hypothetical protein ACTSRW_05595 [Candidatus Helarchaeota archaeon]
MTKKAHQLSKTAKRVLLQGIDGITIKELVDALEDNYKSRDACWAAISRLTKKLNERGLIKLQGGKRSRFLTTTIDGKLQVQKEIPFNLPPRSRLKSSARTAINSEVQVKLEDLILEILAKHGELTIRHIFQLTRKKILSREIKIIKQTRIPYYYLNWTLVHEPLAKIIQEKETSRNESNE